MCIVPTAVIESAIEGVPVKHRNATRDATSLTFHWYGPAVNINPAIFNCMVRVYERIVAEQLPTSGDAFAEFQASYLYRGGQRVLPPH